MVALNSLSVRDKQILSKIHLHGDDSILSLASALGYREHTVRRTIGELKEKAIVFGYTLINPYCCGLSEFGIYFSIEGSTGREKFLKLLVDSDSVLLLMELGGEYSYVVSVLHRDPWSVTKFLTSAIELCDVSIGRKSMVCYYSYTQFQRKYLYSETSVRSHVTTDRPEAIPVLDGLDHKILSLLAQYPGETPSIVARKLKIPLSTIDYRLKQLHQSDTYHGTVYELNTGALGIQVFWILISVNDFGGVTAEKVFHFCQKHHHVTRFVKCLGEWDFELCVEVWNIKTLSEIRVALEDNLGIALVGLKIVSLIEEQKWCLYPFRSKPPWL